VVHYRNLGCLFVVFKELIEFLSLLLILFNLLVKVKSGE